MGKFADAFEKLADRIVIEDAAGEAGRNWTEDFANENGRYSCQCVDCDNVFIGHKRRVVCKLCAEAKAHDDIGDSR